MRGHASKSDPADLRLTGPGPSGAGNYRPTFPPPMEGPTELRSTIDRAWLESAAAREPLEHAYTLWDLDRFPDRIRVTSVLRDGRTMGYLLVWPGPPGISVVHWHGEGPATERLAAALPERPLVAIVPGSVRDRVVAARGEAREYPEEMMLAVRPMPPGAIEGPGTVRRLVADDALELWAWARGRSEPPAAEYPGLDPGTEAVWGAFDDDGRLVGAARAAVRLPREWVVAGVFVAPEARRQRFGRRLVAGVRTAAEAAGARTGLYVREDRPEARRLYEALGFRAIARRLWLDLGSGLEP